VCRQRDKFAFTIAMFDVIFAIVRQGISTVSLYISIWKCVN